MQKFDLSLLTDLDPELQVKRKNIKDNSHQQLSTALLHILQEVQHEVACFSEDENISPTIAELNGIINQVSKKLGFELSSYEKDQILSYVETEKNPFGILQPFVDDKRISDIIITNYANISVQQGRKNLNTDITFPSQSAYEAFVERILKKGGASISTKKPIADGMIGSFARLHAVHQSLCDTGPYLTIRLNRYREVLCSDLVKVGMAPQEIFDYLQTIVKTGQTVLVVGEVATGKTTLVRALASTIPEQDAILVIEDTPEIRLTHPHVRYMRTREANTEGQGRVAPSECIRAGMRMAMNRIIFGEMRDAEAAEAFVDVCASGHPGLSTIHAKSGTDAITRLELFLGRAEKGVAGEVLLKQIATAVQVVVFLSICPITGKRRIFEVKELGVVADGILRQKDIFRYDTSKGQPRWEILCRSSNFKESLENGNNPVFLSKMPPYLNVSL